MTTFKVGEIAIGQNLSWEQYNGAECEIIAPLEIRPTLPTSTFVREDRLTYLVRWADGTVSAQEPRDLRKKRPPESDESTARQAMLDCIERAKMPMGVPA